MATDAEVRSAVIKTLIKLKNEGKRLSGSFVARGGNVILTICHHSDDELSVSYSCYSSMWSWIIPKTELVS